MASIDDFINYMGLGNSEEVDTSEEQVKKQVKTIKTNKLDSNFQEIERRLQEAEYYRQLLSLDLFEDVPDQDIANRIQGEIRNFIKRQLEGILSMGQPPKIAEVFTQDEIKVLKLFANKFMQRPKLVNVLSKENPKKSRKVSVPRIDSTLLNKIKPQQEEVEEEEIIVEEVKKVKEVNNHPPKIPFPTKHAAEAIFLQKASETAGLVAQKVNQLKIDQQAMIRGGDDE